MGRNQADTAATGGSGPGKLPSVMSIVVNYRGLRHTRGCVTSLLEVDYPNHSVVVVDNASGGGDFEALRAEFGSSIEVIHADRNLGYGGAANLGLELARESGASYAWVLNNDTEVDPAAVRELVGAMERETDYGIMSPRIDAPVGPESPFGIWYAGGTANLAKVTTRQETMASDSPLAVVPTGYITGCAMFIRCRALAETGLFWAPLFLYWEDVDLSFRMRRAGWRLGVVPAARVFHIIHGSVASGVVRYYYYRNAILVANRHLHARGAAQATLSLAVRASRRCAASILKRDGPFPFAEARGLLVGVAATIGLVRLAE